MGDSPKCDTSPSSLASEGWTADSPEPATPSLDSVSPIFGDAPSSPSDSPASGSLPTCETWAIEAVGRKMSGGPEVGLGIRKDGPMFTLDKESHHAVAIFNPYRTLESDGSITSGFAERPVVDALHRPTRNKEPLLLISSSAEGFDALNHISTGNTMRTLRNKAGGVFDSLLISSSADSPVPISPSQESEPDSPEPGRDSSSSSPASQENLFDPEDTFSLKTSLASFHRTGDGTLEPSSGSWPTSAFLIWPIGLLTANSSEYPNVGGVCSSLRDVLEAVVAPKYFLSPRTAAGILRRAEKRGKKLPEHLEAALVNVAGPRTPSA